jgi:hypothetical protein
MFTGRYVPAALDQPALLPSRTSYFGEVRSAESWKFPGRLGKLDGIAAVSLLPNEMHGRVVFVEGDLERFLAAADEFGRNCFGKINRLVGR